MKIGSNGMIKLWRLNLQSNEQPEKTEYEILGNQMAIIPNYEEKAVLAVSSAEQIAYHNIKDLSVVKMLDDDPDFNITGILTSPCGRILIVDGYREIEIWDAYSANKVYEIEHRRTTPLILSSDLLIFSFELKTAKKSLFGEQSLALINFQHSGFTR